MHHLIQKAFHIHIHMHRFIIPITYHFHDGNLFHLMKLGKAFLFQLPEHISFRNGSDISSLGGKQGNSRISVVLHFFQHLSETVVLLHISHVAFRGKKK